MNQLERIEWTNLWIENSGNDKPRVLCIGDSITNGYKCPLQAKIIDKYYVTAIMTSKGIDNTYFLKEIDLFTSEEDYDYQIIHFNNGLHGGGNKEHYKEYYRKAVEFLRNKYPKARIILGLSTPVSDKEHTKILDTSVPARNEAVTEIAAEFGLEVSDLYSVAAQHMEYRTGVGDGCHYNAAGYNAFADVLAEMILHGGRA